jgi:hypothetical protein
MARYLERQAEARALGLEMGDLAEVVPYEAGPVQPIDARIAWEEALVALKSFDIKAKMKAPAGWVPLVAQSEPQVAIAFCVGNFPQLVRDFHRLLQQTDLTALRPTATATPVNVSAFLDWVDDVAKAPKFPEVLLALGGLRLARQFERAEAFRRLVESQVPADQRAAWDNEVAALAWHQGRAEEALQAWKKQTPSLPVRFNRAMAELFLGHADVARMAFEQVMQELPENAAWHHLARLYHTLTLLRG